MIELTLEATSEAEGFALHDINEMLYEAQQELERIISNGGTITLPLHIELEGDTGHVDLWVKAEAVHVPA